MMSVSDVASAGGVILQLVTTVQILGNNYYRASQAWHDFPTQVKLLRVKQADLEACFNRYGEDLEPYFLELWEYARELLKTEESRLQLRQREASEKPRGCSCFRRTGRRVGEMWFPDQIGKAIQSVINAYDAIQTQLKSRSELNQIAREELKHKPVKLSFKKQSQSHYVPRGCEGQICFALEESGDSCPSVVLLYGGPGTGKTTVVRQVSASYDVDEFIFDQVVYLECGSELNREDAEVRVLQKLGWAEASESTEKFKYRDVRTGLLQNLLRKKKLLIVLDDLWESGLPLLQRLLGLSGAGVKFLVSSQREDLCDILECRFKIFPIGDLQQSESEQILVMHAGLRDERIPDRLQEIAQKLLDEAGGIPLIIATLGAQIALTKDADNLEVWKWVQIDFVQYLNREPPSKLVISTRYPRNYWSALQLAIAPLTQADKHLFYLLCMCRGPSVPQHILQIFCSITLDYNPVSFRRWKETLKSANLVFEKVDTMLSIHSATRRLVEEYMRGSLESVKQNLTEKASTSFPSASESLSRDAKVTTVLVYIYLDAELSPSLASQVGIESTRVDAAVKTVIEPITKLFVPEVISQGNSTDEVHVSASEHLLDMVVFLDFICNNTLNRDHVSQLLDLPTGFTESRIMETLVFLANMPLLEASFWKKNTLGRIPDILLRLWQEAPLLDVQIQATRALGGFCICDVQTRAHVVNTSGMLHHATRSLSQDLNPSLQDLAAWIIFYAALPCGNDSVTDLKIVNFPNLLESLGTSLSKAEYPILQTVATGAIAYMAAVDERTTERILDCPGLLNHLVKAVNQEQNSELAAHAARAIWNLRARTTNSTIINEITYFPNLLESLNESLSKAGNLINKAIATGAIANLGGTEHQPTMERILNLPGLLGNLVKEMDQKENSDLAEQAVRVIYNLAATEDSKMKDKLSRVPHMLESLVVLLSDAQGPDVQVYAADSIARLGNGDEVTKMRILNLPGLLSRLVKALDNELNAKLAESAAAAISNLTMVKDSTMKNTIAHMPGMLESLNNSLSKANLVLQARAAGAVANLGLGDQSSKERIFSHRGLLDNVVKAIEQDQNLELAQHAAAAIWNLATTKDLTMKGDILRFPKLMESLQVSLCKASNPTLQWTAIRAICVISIFGSDGVRINDTVFDFPGLLDALVKATDPEQNMDLAKTAAIAILNFTAVQDSTTRDNIARCPNLLERLGILLSKVQIPDLQENAAAAIANLGFWDDESMKDRILRLPELLQHLVRAMEQDQNLDLAKQASRVILSLTFTKDSAMKEIIAQSSNLLEILGTSLSRTGNPDLQENAALVVCHLAFENQSNRDRILKVPKLLHNLVKSMDQEQSPDLTQVAARAIWNLVATKDSRMKAYLAHFPNLLETVGASLSKADNPIQQRIAAGIINNLGFGDQPTRERILSLPGLMLDLIKGMDQGEDFVFAQEASGTIRSLAKTEDSTLKSSIACFPNLLESLSASLSKAANSVVQINAAEAIVGLGSGEQSIRERLLATPGLLDRLVEAADQEQNLKVALSATEAIVNLAMTENSTIACFPNLLECLGASLSKTECPALQRSAAIAIGNLVTGDETTKERILDVPGLLDRLVEAMDQQQNLDLAELAARFFDNLSETEDSAMRNRVACFPKLLESLRVRASAFESPNPSLQSYAASALANLGLNIHSIKESTLDLPGRLNNSVGSVDPIDTTCHVVCEVA